MMTVPEGMGLDHLDQVIDRITYVGGLGDELDVQIPENTPELPQHVKLTEKARKQRVLRVNPNVDSITKDPIVVKVTGYNQITPMTADPDLTDQEMVVADNVPVDFPQTQVYSENPTFKARTKDVAIPGQLAPGTKYAGIPSGVIRQDIPAITRQHGPDKIVYEQDASSSPDTDVRQTVHQDYAAESELPNVSEASLLSGIIRVDENADFGQIEAILSIASTVANIGATGYGVYAKKRQAQQAKKQAAQAASAQAAQEAALFNQQFGQQMGQVPVAVAPASTPTLVSPGAPMATVIASPTGPVLAPASPGVTLAPTSIAGMDTQTLLIYGGIGFALLLGLVVVLKS